MHTRREEIEEVLVDTYGEYEQLCSWEVVLTESVSLPFKAAMMGLPVVVSQFRISHSNVLQCLIIRDKEKQEKWVAVEDLDSKPLPREFKHLLSLYRSWLEGDY